MLGGAGLPNLGHPAADGLCPGGQEHGQLSPGHGIVQPQAVVRENDAPGLLEGDQFLKTGLLPAYICKGAVVGHKLFHRNHPVAVGLEELQLLL